MLTFLQLRNQFILPVIAGVAATLLVFVITSKYGLALSPDSACYISMADNVLRGNGYAIYDFEPAVDWPPLYPTVLAAGKLIGINIKSWARILNALLFGYFVYSLTIWLWQKIKWRPLLWVGCFGFLLSPILIHISKFAWSELPFSILVFLCLARLSEINSESKLSDTFTMAVLVSLACLTRYVGVTLAIYCLIWILSSKFNLKVKLLHSAVFVFTAFAPLTLWILRNLDVSSTFAGHRTPSSLSFLGNIYSASDTVSSWLLPQQWDMIARVPLAGLIIFLTFYFLRRSLKKDDHRHETKSPIFVMLYYFIFYSLFMIIITSTIASGNMETRFLSPIYVPLLISIILAVDFLMGNLQFSRKQFKTIVLTFSVFWIVNLTINTFKDAAFSLKDGAGGYASTKWQDSQLVAYLKTNPPQNKLFSNYPDGIYVLSGLSSSMSPQKLYYASISAPPNQIENLQAEIENSGFVILAWFGDSDRGILFSLTELKTSFDLTLLHEFSDGSLYRISAKPPGVK